jgi:hypothetical protein
MALSGSSTKWGLSAVLLEAGRLMGDIISVEDGSSAEEAETEEDNLTEKEVFIDIEASTESEVEASDVSIEVAVSLRTCF